MLPIFKDYLFFDHLCFNPLCPQHRLLATDDVTNFSTQILSDCRLKYQDNQQVRSKIARNCDAHPNGWFFIETIKSYSIATYRIATIGVPLCIQEPSLEMVFFGFVVCNHERILYSPAIREIMEDYYNFVGPKPAFKMTTKSVLDIKTGSDSWDFETTFNRFIQNSATYLIQKHLQHC